MKIEEVANVWGVSYRTVYRLIDEGLIPVKMRPRDTPLVMDVEDSLVFSVKQKLDGLEKVGRNSLRELLKGGK